MSYGYANHTGMSTAFSRGRTQTSICTCSHQVVSRSTGCSDFVIGFARMGTTARCTSEPSGNWRRVHGGTFRTMPTRKPRSSRKSRACHAAHAEKAHAHAQSIVRSHCPEPHYCASPCGQQGGALGGFTDETSRSSRSRPLAPIFRALNGALNSSVSYCRCPCPAAHSAHERPARPASGLRTRC